MELNKNGLKVSLLILLPALLLCGCFSTGSRDDSGKSIGPSGTFQDLVHRIEFPDDLDPRSAYVALKASEETNLFYNLEPPRGDSVAVEESISTSLATLLAKGDTVLYIKFECNVCLPSDSRRSMQRVHYILKENKSAPIEFRFMVQANPELELSQDYPDSEPGISLTVLRDGITYDRVDVPVKVVSGGTGTKPFNERPVSNGTKKNKTATPESAVTSRTAIWAKDRSFQKRQNSRPDISFELVEGNGTPLLLHVMIYKSALQRSQNPIFVPSDEPSIADKSQTDGLEFHYLTGFESFDEVKKMTKRLYLRLSCLTVAPSTPDGQVFREKLKSELKQDCHGHVQGGEKWSDQEQKDVGSELADIGNELFQGLVDDQALLDGFGRLVVLGKERIATKPIRIVFKTNVHLPIQLLYPPGEYKTEDPLFFGLLFDLAETQYLKAPRITELVKFTDQGWETVFGGFKGDFRPLDKTNENTDKTQTADRIASFASSHHEYIRKVVVARGGSDFKNQVTTQDFLAALVTNRGSIDLIWTYVHGDARGWSGEYYRNLDSTPKLIFGWSQEGRIDSLPEGTIKSAMRKKMYGHESRPFKKGPFVVLIACETGSSGPGGTGGNAFRQEFFRLGARALLTTEAEIPAGTASLFGALLIDNLVKAMPPSEAVLEARRQLLRQKANLWSLLFHYQGAHGIFAGP